MAEQKPTGYFAGQVPTQHAAVTAKPDGTPMSQEEVNAEILNKLDLILVTLKNKL